MDCVSFCLLYRINTERVRAGPVFSTREPLSGNFANGPIYDHSDHSPMRPNAHACKLLSDLTLTPKWNYAVNNSLIKGIVVESQ